MGSGVPPPDGVSPAGGFTVDAAVYADGGGSIKAGNTKTLCAGAATSHSHGRDYSCERNMKTPPADAGVATSPLRKDSSDQPLYGADDGGYSSVPSMKPPTSSENGIPAAKRCRVADVNALVQHKEVPPITRRGPSVNLNVDVLMEIFARLQPDVLLRMATACSFFREVIRSSDFRHCYRSNQKGKMLGFFMKKKARGKTRVMYPYVRCDGLSAQMSRASESIRDLWVSAETCPNSYWPYFELLDSRDGKLLLLAGNSSRDQDMFVFYPHARKNRHRQIPRLRFFHDTQIVTAALLPDERTHHYNVIVLAKRVSRSKVTLNTPLVETVVACYSSSAGRWIKAKTIQSFVLPAKKMLQIGSVLIDDMIYFLHRGEELITVQISSLELATTILPDIGGAKKTTLRTSHISRGQGSQLCLAMVSGRNIRVYTYSNPSKSWENKTNWLTLGGGIKVIGSSESQGLILVKTGTLDVVSVEMETGLVKSVSVGNCESDEVLAYEQECPAVSQMIM